MIIGILSFIHHTLCCIYFVKHHWKFVSNNFYVLILQEFSQFVLEFQYI